MEIRCFKLHLFAQLCLLLAALLADRAVRCDKQYEFQCVNKECSDILFEGLNQFKHTGDGELFNLGKGEYVDIYGENEDFYLAQKKGVNHRKGLVKKSYVIIQKSLYKDAQLVKIKANFKDKQFHLIDSFNNLTDTRNQSVEQLDNVGGVFREVNVAANLSDNQIDPKPTDHQVSEPADPIKPTDQIKKPIDQTNKLTDQIHKSTDENLSSEAKPAPSLDAPQFKEPLVKKLRSRLVSEDLPVQKASDDLSLKVPEIHDFADEAKSADHDVNHSVNQNANQNVNQIVDKKIESNTDNTTDTSDQKPTEQQPELKPNEVPQNESLSIKSLSTESSNVADSKPEVKLDAPLDDLNKLKDAYKQPVDNSAAFQVKEIDTKNVEQADKSTQTEPANDSKPDVKDGLPEADHPVEHHHKPVEHHDEPAAQQETHNDLPMPMSTAPPLDIAAQRHENSATSPLPDLNAQSSTQSPVDSQPPVDKQPNHLDNTGIPADNQKVNNSPSNQPDVGAPSVIEPDSYQPPKHPAAHEPIHSQPPIAHESIHSQPPVVHEPVQPSQPPIAHEPIHSQPPIEPQVRQELPGSRHTDNSIPKNYDNPEEAIQQQETSTEPPKVEEPVKEEEPVTEEFRHPKQLNKPDRKANIKNLSRKSRDEENSTAENINAANKANDDHPTVPAAAIPADNPSQLPICAPADSMKIEEPSIAIIALRSLLSNFTYLLPEGMVLFLESGLQVSVRLLMFVFIIGLLWIILFAIKLFYLSISNETALKNHLYESQSKLSQLQRERDDLRNRLNAQNLRMSRGLEEQRYEVDQLANRLNAENEQLKEGRIVMEAKLREQLELVKSLQGKAEQLNKDSGELVKENEELSEQLNEEVRTRDHLQNKLNQLEELNKELITQQEQIRKLAKAKDGEIDCLNERLDEQRKLTAEKEIEISCLNKMLSELKEDGPRIKREPNEESTEASEQEDSEPNDSVTKERRQSTSNFYDVVKLRCEIEKIEKERNDANEKLKASLEKVDALERKLAALEQESSQNDEAKSKVLKEKEDAEKYLDFLKKYYNENKNELQKELGVCQYKEKQLAEENRELQEKLETLEKRADESEQKYQQCKKEFDETEKQLKGELLAANKSASEHWRSAQSLKIELTSVKKDAEYLRQQLHRPMASSDSPILSLPDLPKPMLDMLAGQLAPTGGLSSLTGLMSSGGNFMTAPSPIPPQSLLPNSTDYQANYHSGYSSLPFTSQPDSSIYNHVSSGFPSLDPSIDPSMMNGLVSSMVNSMVNSSLANSNPMMNNTLMSNSLMNSNQINNNPLNSNLMNDSLVGNSMANNRSDVYAGADYQYASMPNLPYPNQQQQFDPRFNASMNQNSSNAAMYANQQQGNHQQHANQQANHQQQHANQQANHQQTNPTNQQWNAYSFANSSSANPADTSMNHHHPTSNSPHPSLHNV